MPLAECALTHRHPAEHANADGVESHRLLARSTSEWRSWRLLVLEFGLYQVAQIVVPVVSGLSGVNRGSKQFLRTNGDVSAGHAGPPCRIRDPEDLVFGRRPPRCLQHLG
jgi:hypothetical protein